MSRFGALIKVSVFCAFALQGGCLFSAQSNPIFSAKLDPLIPSATATYRSSSNTENSTMTNESSSSTVDSDLPDASSVAVHSDVAAQLGAAIVETDKGTVYRFPDFHQRAKNYFYALVGPGAFIEAALTLVP